MKLQTYISEWDQSIIEYIRVKFSVDRKTAEALAYLITGYVKMQHFGFDEVERERGLIHHLTKFVTDGLVLVEILEFIRWMDKEYWSLSNRADWWKRLDDWDKK